MEENSKDKQSHLLDPVQIQMLLEAGAEDSLELFSELIGLYEEESQEKLVEIRKHYADQNFDSLGRAAHALAGSSANIGGSQVWMKAKEVENLCKAGNGDEAGLLVEHLQATYDETIAALHAFISQLESSSD